MKNQDGGFKVPLFDRKPSECHVRCQSLIGSYASTRSTFNLIGPCNNIQTHKATTPQRVIFSKWLNKKGSYSRRLLLPFALPPYPLPLSTPSTQANHPTKNKTAGSQFACPTLNLTSIQYFYHHHHPERSP